MTRLIEFFIALGLVIALFLIVGLVLPSKRHLEETVETNRNMTIVFDTVNSVRRLKDWNSLLPNKSAELKYSGGDANNSGVGARVDFNSKEKAWGVGHWEIAGNKVPDSIGGGGEVSYAIVDGAPGKDKKSVITLERTGKNGKNVKIKQLYGVAYGFNLFGRFSGMYISGHVGDRLKGSLAKLTNMLATVPNFDYRIPDSKLRGLAIVEVPAEDLLVVEAGNIDRTNEAIRGSINSNIEWIHRVMDSNGLESTGPLRIVTTDFGAEKYAFDVALPVRKRGGSAIKATATDAKPADAAATPEAAPAVSAGALKVSVSGTPVEYVHTEAHKSASVNYAGYMAELDMARSSLRAWAMTNGYEVTERPYESWIGGVDKSFTTDGTYKIYWAIK